MSYKFVIVSDAYIAYLQKTEPRVMSNKVDSRVYHRKYLGIVEVLQGYHYFIPLSSPKSKDFTSSGKPKTDSLITIYIKDARRLYGTLRLNNMIPVPESEIEPYDLNDEGDFKYKLIVLNELYFLRKNKDKVERTAKNLYEAKKGLQDNAKGRFPLLELTLDFSQLEKCCDAWQTAASKTRR